MKDISEVPEQVHSLKRRTIRSLAVEAIDQEDCTYITKRLDEVVKRIEEIRIKKENDGYPK